MHSLCWALFMCGGIPYTRALTAGIRRCEYSSHVQYTCVTIKLYKGVYLSNVHVSRRAYGASIMWGYTRKCPHTLIIVWQTYYTYKPAHTVCRLQPGTYGACSAYIFMPIYTCNAHVYVSIHTYTHPRANRYIGYTHIFVEHLYLYSPDMRVWGPHIPRMYCISRGLPLRGVQAGRCG